ncbi:MAG: hypothetical protein KBB55_02620 [Candidatus Buchananbacteria bacterium]|nr:hypothetical protein [Candidatus Buchananbacteria bacterium]
MLGFNKKGVSLGRKFCARGLGLVTIAEPPQKEVLDSTLDSLMAYHYCPNCKTYRWDRHFEHLSAAAHFNCGGCGVQRSTKHLRGFSWLLITEAVRLAQELHPHLKPGSKVVLLAFYYAAIGLGKHLPEHRDGKTTSELEFEASTLFFCRFTSRQS